MGLALLHFENDVAVNRSSFDFTKLRSIFNGFALPQQPLPGPAILDSSYIPLLKSLAKPAQIHLDAIGQKLALAFTSDENNLLPRTSEKKDERIHRKASSKYGDNHRHHCDFAAVTVELWDAESAMDVIDAFGINSGQDHVLTLEDGTELAVVEFENGLSGYNGLKAGLPCATAIVAIKFNHEGENHTYTCEIQFRPGQSSPHLKASHDAFTAFREAAADVQVIETMFQPDNNKNVRHCRDALTEQLVERKKEMKEAGTRRAAENLLAVTNAPWLKAIQNYVPGSRNSTENLVSVMPHGISSAGLHLAA